MLEMSELLILLNKVLQVVGLNNNVEAAEGGSLKFLGPDASKADGFPNLWDIRFLGGLEGKSELAEHDVHGCKLLVVSCSLEEHLGGPVKTGFEASLTYLDDVSLVGLSDEVLELSHKLVSAFGVGKDKLLIDDFLFECFSCHGQETDELLEALLGLGDVDDHHVHGWVLSLDEAVNGLSEHALVELSLTELGPHLWLVGLLSEFLGTLDIILLFD